MGGEDSNSWTDTERSVFTTQNSSVPMKSEGEFVVSSTGTMSADYKKLKVNYHEQRLSQSKWAFRLSLGGSIVGFLVIIISVFLGIFTGDSQWSGIVSGTIVEAVSALFYTLSNKVNEKISEFFEELTKDSNIKDSIGLIEQVKNDDIRDELVVKMSLHLSGIDEEKICKKTREICNEKIE